MKKFISFIITVVMLSSCLGITSFASSPTVTFSDDFQTLYANSTTYYTVDPSILNTSGETVNKDVQLSPAQKETVKKVDLLTDSGEDVFFATIHYKNGSYLSVTYLRDAVLDEYTKLTNNEIENYIINFLWPEGNTVTAKRELIFGEAVTLTSKELQRVEPWYAQAETDSNVFQLYTGAVLSYEDEYYYADFEELGFDKMNWKNFLPQDYTSMSVHKIISPELIRKLENAENKFYSDDLGFFYDDKFTEKVSVFFMIFAFAVIPLAVCIIFLILALRSKTFYKKLYAAVSIISATEIVVFTIIMAILMGAN